MECWLAGWLAGYAFSERARPETHHRRRSRGRRRPASTRRRAASARGAARVFHEAPPSPSGASRRRARGPPTHFSNPTTSRRPADTSTGSSASRAARRQRAIAGRGDDRQAAAVGREGRGTCRHLNRRRPRRPAGAWRAGAVGRGPSAGAAAAWLPCFTVQLRNRAQQLETERRSTATSRAARRRRSRLPYLVVVGAPHSIQTPETSQNRRAPPRRPGGDRRPW